MKRYFGYTNFFDDHADPSFEFKNLNGNFYVILRFSLISIFFGERFFDKLINSLNKLNLNYSNDSFQ